MALKRIPLSLAPNQIRTLKNLGAKLGLDRTNTIRYCINRIAEQEGIKVTPIKN